MSETNPFDLDAYVARLGVASPLSADVATLRALHAAHRAAIPFENLDVRLGRTVRLDPEGLQEKLVRRGRGGYCFEQNTLFASVLRAVGFSVETLEARVRPPGAKMVLPRTHMVLRVEADGRGWLADVGFGGDGPLEPVPLDGEESEQPWGPFAVSTEPAGVHVLRRRADDGWRDLYAFTLTPALPVDYQVAHHFTSTHPSSPFVQGLTVQRTTLELRQVLRARTFTEQDAAGERVRELTDDEVVDVVTRVFGLEVTEAEVLEALRSNA